MLETEFLKLKYHNNVETNTDEVNAEEYFNNNYKKIDANAKSQNTTITNLQNKVNSLELLAQQQPWGKVKGESLHIEDSAEWDGNRLNISGNLRQEKRSGKNFIPLSVNRTLNGVTLSVDKNGIYTLNGTATNTCFFNIPLKEVLPAGTSKTMSLNVLSGTATGDKAFYFAFRVRNSNDVYSGVPDVAELQYLVSGKARVTKTITNECASAEIAVLSGVTLNNVKLTIQLEEGSVATDFETYGAMPSTEFPSMPVVATGVQKIRQFGKNWFNKNNVNKLNAVPDVYSITANSSAKSFYIKIKPDTYTISRKIVGSRFVVGTTTNLPTVGEAIIDRKGNNSGSSITLTTSKNANYLVVYYLYNSTESEQEILDSIQIERGSKATLYEPYTEQIHTLNLSSTELCKITDVNGNVVAQDRAVYRDGKWQWEKKIKKFTLKGTEAWGKSGNTANISYFLNSTEINGIDINTITNAETNRDFIAKAICNYFSAVNLNTIFSNTEGFAIDITSNNIIELRLGFGLDTEITTVALLKEWLAQKYQSGNPVTIYFILAIPVYTDCIAEQSAVLDKLYNNFKLQKGTNNIIVESNNGVGVEMELDYMQDLLTKLNLLEAMCVSNASQEV